MKVFKFGGASVNSADAVRNMAQIVQSHLEPGKPLVVVVSAMGKTTNLLEKLVPGVTDDTHELRRQLEEYHLKIYKDLIPCVDGADNAVQGLLRKLDDVLASLQPEADQYNYNYDQVVSFGELISTTIIAEYLNSHGISTQWLDARQLVITDNHYREGHVDWTKTQAACQRLVADEEAPSRHQVIITQGFIGGTPDSHTTTLGREGSDYSAAILAYCLGAESVTIWKDVPGFLNADPKFFHDTVKIGQIPYNEAIELAYYGASVIHPKTVKPIQNKGIPLYIRSFISPEVEGSVVGNYHTISPETPLYIFKNNQILLSILPRDYSFIAEDNLQVIFGILSKIGIRVNLMQNSALSFSICIDNNPQLVAPLIEELKSMFRVRYNDNLQLITIRYYTQEVIDRIVANRPILLEQRSRTTEQLIVPA
ncbi:MAG: aspartate kinase [Bacteroidales bacterium]|nr:aspartate kinase [Bacteroidales bacterium]MBR6844928.1 aspartate kinase [Bacteroidales bacterium]